MSMQKTAHDFQLSLVAFQRAQQVSAERQRTVVEGAKHAVEEEQAASCVYTLVTRPVTSQAA